MTPNPQRDPTGRAHSIARAVVIAVLAALAVASGFRAGVFHSTDQAPSVYAWGP